MRCSTTPTPRVALRWRPRACRRSSRAERTARSSTTPSRATSSRLRPTPCRADRETDLSSCGLSSCACSSVHHHRFSQVLQAIEEAAARTRRRFSGVAVRHLARLTDVERGRAEAAALAALRRLALLVAVVLFVARQPEAAQASAPAHVPHPLVGALVDLAAVLVPSGVEVVFGLRYEHVAGEIERAADQATGLALLAVPAQRYLLHYLEGLLALAIADDDRAQLERLAAELVAGLHH